MSEIKSKRNWKMRVQDILDCIDRVKAYVSEMSFDEFRNDQKTVDAVIRNFEIIGEAAGYIPETIQDKYPDLAWLEMRGMRNIMVLNILALACRLSGRQSSMIWTHSHLVSNEFWKLNIT